MSRMKSDGAGGFFVFRTHKIARRLTKNAAHECPNRVARRIRSRRSAKLRASRHCARQFMRQILVLRARFLGELLFEIRPAPSASRSSPTARICTARSPAFFAAPMPTVATGTPGGICTMDSNESRPFSDLLSIGTPMTGRVVNAAVTPGRCAAPPAPAMMTRRPRPAALPAYCSKSLRRAMRGDDPGFAGDAEFGQHIGGGLHRRPVRIAAHQNADERLGEILNCSCAQN